MNKDHLDDWLRHIRALATDIGPRGSTTEAERRAADYAAHHFESLGLEACIEHFTSAVSSYQFFIFVGSLFITGFVVYPLAGRVSAVAALLLGLTGLFSICMELMYRPNPIRFIQPKGRSQNVYATLMPAREHRQDLILIGHLDTNRTPLIFRSANWINAWRVISSIIFFAFLASIVTYTIGVLTQSPLIWPILTAPGLIAGAALVGFCLQAELSPYSHGANDNATAAGLVMHLAERFSQERLQHTRVWFVCTGCEEVKHYGADTFFRDHHSEFVNPKALVFEMLGRDGPGYLMKESTISLFTFRASPVMVENAQAVAREHPELGAHPTKVDGGHTEMTDAIRYGVPAITLIGIDEGGTRFGYDGPEIYWHHKLDIVENLLPDVLERNYRFTWEFIQRLDRSV